MVVIERILSRIEGIKNDRKPEIHIWTQSDREGNQKEIPLFHAEGKEKRLQKQALYSYI